MLFSALQRHTGWLILSTLLLFLASQLYPSLFVAVGALAWLVVIVEWSRLPVGSRRQACVLLVAGCAALLFSAWHGVFLGWRTILTQNLQLLPMFIAVSFLALTNPANQDDDLPRGWRSVATTAVGTTLLGAVINISILFVFGDRLQRNNSLTKAQAIILGRSFCTASWWSPFFISAGVALTYAPGMQYSRTLLPGLLLCAIALCYSIVEVGFVRRIEFTGYPVRVESLVVPVLLAVAVLTGHHFFPEVGMILLICLVAPPAAILLMRYRPRVPHLYDFIRNRIVSTVSQFVLFLTAGVFSVGITSVIHVYPDLFSFADETFGHGLFALMSALLIGMGLIGVHPLVGISIVSPLLLPLHVDPSRLGFLFLTSWAISTGSSPLSGVGLVLIGRYQVPPKVVLASNFPYAVVMWFLANMVNVFYFG